MGIYLFINLILCLKYLASDWKLPQWSNHVPFGHKLGKNTCYIVELVVHKACLGYISVKFLVLTRITSPGKKLINT